MRGLTIIGASTDAGELDVAAAACEALRERGSEVSAYVPVALGAEEGVAKLAAVCGRAPDVISPPALEATPEGLLDGARRAAGGDVLVSVLSGGLLAPLGPRYAVRDLAAELGAPVVLAVRFGDEAVNVARLTLESARSARLRVVAIVLTNVVEGARDEVESHTGVTVELTSRAREWPLDAWLEPPDDPAVAEVAHGAEVVLEPYRSWEEQPIGDPRTTPRPGLMQALASIVEAEGPMTATRAYSLANRAAGGRKLTGAVRTPLSSALYWLAREGKVLITREEDAPWQGDDLVRAPDAPAVRLRELGPRTLEEVPLDEIAELMRRLGPQPDLRRAVLNTYGLVRMTARAEQYLTTAEELL